MAGITGGAALNHSSMARLTGSTARLTQRLLPLDAFTQGGDTYGEAQYHHMFFSSRCFRLVGDRQRRGDFATAIGGEMMGEDCQLQFSSRGSTVDGKLKTLGSPSAA